MYYPHSVKRSVRNGKTGKETTETDYGVKNCDERDKLISRFGKERFEKLVENDSHYQKFKEYPIPPGYKWLFQHFITMWSNCNRDFNGNVQFGFHTIMEYSECMKIPFNLYEKKLLIKMKDWVSDTIYKLTK